MPPAALMTSTPIAVSQPPAASEHFVPMPMSVMPPAAPRSSTPNPVSQPPAASVPSVPMPVSQPLACPPPRPVAVQRPPPPSFNPMEGRTVRVEPTSNIGPFAPVVEYTPALSSYAMSANLARVPVLNHHKQVVPSKRPKFPSLSPNSKLNIYISSQPVHNLPSHMEQVYREDLTLDVLKS